MVNHAWNGEHDWKVGEPITQEKMNSIEGGIALAHEGISTNSGSITALTGRLGRDEEDISEAVQKARDALSTVNQNTQAISEGQRAWVQVTGEDLAVYDSTNDSFTRSLTQGISNKIRAVTDPLASSLSETDETATAAWDLAGEVKDWVDDARKVGTITDPINGRQVQATSLAAKIADIDDKISNMDSTVDGIKTLVNPDGGRDVVTRLTALDANTTPTMNVPQIITEIQGARGTNSKGGNNTALSQRFTQDEDRISANETAITNLQTGKLNADSTGIVNSLDETYTNKALSANMGNTIKQMFGTGVSTSQGSTVVDLIGSAQTSATNSANSYTDTQNTNYHVSEINAAHRTGLTDTNGQTITDTLDNRFDDIETRLNAVDNSSSGTVHGLDTRITALETEVDMTGANSRIDLMETEIGNAHRANVNNDTLDNRFDDIETELTNAHTSTVVRTPGANDDDPDTDTTYGSLDARLEAIETHAANARTDINTIAGELAMVNNGTIIDTNTKIDRLEADVQAFATELDMARDQTGALVDTNTRVDAITTEIDNAHRTLDNGTDTLDNRFDDIESDISDINDTLGNGFNTTTNTVAATIAAAITTAEGYTDTKNSDYNVAEINEAHRTHSGHFEEDEETHEQVEIDDTLDLRFDDIEGRLDALDDDQNGAIAGLDARLNAIDGGTALTGTVLGERVSNIETVIDHVKDINDDNDLGGLTQRVSAAEAAITTKASQGDLTTLSNTVGQISTTIVLTKSEVNFNNDNEPTTFVSGNIVDKNDYLIQNPVDDKYYYWKHINDKWHLMGGAGGGGTGNTTGIDLTRAQYNALEAVAQNTDYYVKETSGLVHHYRYVLINNELTEIEIGPADTKIKQYRLDWGTESDINYLYLQEFPYGADVTETSNSTRVSRIPLPSGGTMTAQKLTRIGTRAITQPLGAESAVLLQFFYTSGVEGESGVGELFLEDVSIRDNIAINSGNPSSATTTWPSITPTPAGFYSIDVSSYCTTLGIKHFQLIVRDPDDPTQYKDLKWDVNVMNLTLSSTFTEYSINNINSTVKFTYIANGDIDKVAHFKLGNTVLPTVPLSADTSGEVQEYTIPAQSVAGTYKLEVWLTATANGHDLPPSQSIFRDIIWKDPNSDTVMISCKYRDNVDYPLTQYDTLEIPYAIAGGTTPYTVYYYVDDMDTPVNEVTLTGSSGLWEYHANEKDGHALKIACQGASITFTIDVTKLDIDIAPVTLNLALDFNPQGITNTSGKRLWSNDNYHMTVSDNFDWYNGGYGSDESGDYFLVKAGTRATFDYKMFTSNEDEGIITSNVFDTGKEFKIIFKTAAVRNADAIWFTNMGPSSSNANAKPVGIQLNAHNGFLKTNAASNTEVDGVAATNTYLYFPYSEEDKIELDININQAGENDNFIMSYEDGCPSKAYPYKTTEILYHIDDEEHDPSDIVIGSDDCDVYIYRMRIYDSALSTEQVLRNFIADGKNSTESIDRYTRNSIYYDTKKKEFVPYVGTNTVLDPERLATKIPDVKVLMLETPQFTKSKKDFIPYSSLRCIHAPGGKVFPSRGKQDNWLFQNGYHAGQGTTSDKYGNAARNLDFLFMCDGVHNPSDKVSPKNENFLPGYQSSLILGYGMTDDQGNSLAEEPTYCLDWKDEDTWKPNTNYELNDLVRQNGEVYKCNLNHTSDSTFDVSNWTLQEGYTSKVTLTPTSIPNNFFNLKVNIASSENANNMLLQKRYNDFLPYVSPAKARDARIKNDMEFVPAIIFIKETGQATVNGETITYSRRAFNDSEWHFYALGNIGDSKKTDYTRAYDPNDMNEFTLEISDNNTNNSQFQSGVYMASFYRPIETPIIDNINDYYELSSGGKFGTVEHNEETQYYGNFIKTPDIELNNEKTYYEFIEKRRFIEPYTVEQDTEDDGKLKDTFTALSAAGEAIQPMAYLFPIDYETEWAALDENDEPINMRYWSLTQEKFDGDHSFEMRYACQGNYRDGKLVNDTHGKITVNNKEVSRDKYQVDTLNTEVWRAFYTWLVTSTDQQFIAELEEWCVRTSVAYFYAFTHYYTMMDNRAKNTFWHFAKTGKYRKVSRPVKALLHVYEEAEGTVTEDAQNVGVWIGTFVPTSDTSIDTEKTYYTQYAFDMWVYDTDTALGIDNNGELVFPYGKEDQDFRIDGDPSSSYVFNGAGSIFWRRLRDKFNDSIRSIFTGNRMNECFNADTLIEEFDKYQSCFPEAIWRLDVERKYIRSFTGDTENGASITTKETRFLRDMMQGRKKYQRRQWAKDQDVYFGSKYMLPSVSGDFFEFSCYNPGGQAVTPNWDLTITPYQDMYINISYAETFANPFRAKAGVTYEFKSILNDMNDSRIRVFGANHIQALAGKAKREDPNDPDKITGADGLASFYIKANNFEHGKKLRRLILGSDNVNYVNGNFTTLNIANDYPILEELNIKNCGNLGGAVDLSKSTALKVIEAQGTQVSQILLPGSTGIETLHLPDTVTRLELKSAKQLTDLTINTRQGVANLDNLTQLDIDDSDYSTNINWMTLAATALSHLDLVSILNMHTSSIVNIDELEPFRLKKNTINRVYLGGNLTVTGDWSAIEKTTYENTWQANNLQLQVDANNEVTRYKVVFKLPDDVNGGRELRSVYLTPAPGATTVSLGSDPAYIGLIPSSSLVKPATVAKEYIFGERNAYGYIAWTGWRKSTSVNPVRNDTTIDGDTVLIAVFNESVQTYPLEWYLHEGDATPVRQTEAIAYGSSYDGLAPTVYNLKQSNYTTSTVRISGSNCTYSIFKGWERLPNNLDSTFLNDAHTAFCIYGNWEGEENVPVATILEDQELTPRKLLLLSMYNDNLDLGADLIEVNDTMDLTLGYDSNETGTLLIGEGTSYVMNDSRTYNPTVSFSSVNNPPAFSSNVTPFSSDEGFTIAIDYRFDVSAIQSNWVNGYSILAGCYDKINADTVQGFSLFYDIAEGAPKVCFGDQSKIQTFNTAAYNCYVGSADTADMRNIIVLRHPKNTNVIQVYSGIYSNNILTSLDDAFFVQELTWSNNSSLGKLCFGHTVPDGTTAPIAQLRAGLGTIYWAKYWNKDLGKSECIQLASWPHEKMRFAVEEYPNAENKILNTASKNIIFSALQLSQYGGPTFNANSRGNTIGEIQTWANSTYEDIANKRFFLGLPVVIQSIVNKTAGKASAVICQQGQYNGKYSYYTDYDVVDYAFIPSYPEVTGSTGTYYEGEALQGMPWYKASNTSVISYVNTSFNFNSPSANITHMNLRFPGVPINIGAGANTVYINYTGTDPAYMKIGPTRIKRGDILIYNNVAYIYANDDDVRNGVPIINAGSGVFYCGAGGWVRSKPWWTRSVLEMDPANNTNSFYFINNVDGQMSAGLPSDDGKVGCLFNYSFGI